MRYWLHVKYQESGTPGRIDWVIYEPSDWYTDHCIAPYGTAHGPGKYSMIKYCTVFYSVVLDYKG